VLDNNTAVKILQGNTISPFGGINFVFELLDSLGFEKLISENLPALPAQSQYSWKDIFYSFLSIYLCGGDCIEDIDTNLKHGIGRNPFFKMPSPDTVLRRFSSLTTENQFCRTKRGTVDHAFNTNDVLEKLNIAVLKMLGAFDSEELILDYDNTIIFNEKQDSKMTYKRNPGYQPGVCTVNEHFLLGVENRNGNSDAKSFQKDTLVRMFNTLKKALIKKANHFRADAASYQYDVIKLLQLEVENFYIGCKNSYVEKYFTQITKWEKLDDLMEVGEIRITPFQQQAKEENETAQSFRMIVKRSPKKDGQYDIITQDKNQYRAILTNNDEWSAKEIAQFYNHRGNMEKQFDIMKNDFGWNQMPFSKLEQNTVFLFFTAICRNLYHHIIQVFSKKVQALKPTDRLKKFIFRFILLPAKWIKQGRQIKLKLFGKINFRT